MATLIPVILAGGVGSRLWPTSREFYPKQLLPLTGEDSLLQKAARRALAVAGADHVVTVTTDTHYFSVLDQLGEVAPEFVRHVLAEPTGRNTAAAVALSAIYAAERFEDPILWITPADHVISKPGPLTAGLEIAKRAAEAGKLVTFGVEPLEPDTGFGYIRRGAPFNGEEGAFIVDSFIEKPDREEAEEIIAAGDSYWNSGMFVMSARGFLKEMESTAPDVLEKVRDAVAKADSDARPFRVPKQEYEAIPAVPVDKAVMERSQEVVVIPVDIGWSDVGSWERLWQICEKDPDGNLTQGDVLLEGSERSLVRSDRRLVACVGISDLVVVETADAVLVADRRASAGVGKLVDALKIRQRIEATSHLTDHRPWGSFSILLEGNRFKIKEIIVKPGALLSYQMHHHRAEHWVVIEGTARVTCNDKVTLLSENQSVYIPIGAKHRLENPGVLPLKIVEVQCGAYVGEDDIVRFEDNYGRES